MRTLYFAALISLLADQLSKYIVIFAMDLRRLGEIDVFPPLLRYRYGENRGINFGLFADGSEASRWILIAIAAVICIGVWRWMRRPEMGVLAHLSAGLLIGGAVANVVDRLLYGYVLDFLNTSCCGFDNPFVFNVADIFIFAGAVGLVFFAADNNSAPTEKGK